VDGFLSLLAVPPQDGPGAFALSGHDSEFCDRGLSPSWEDFEAVRQYVTSHVVTVLESNAASRTVTAQETAAQIPAGFRSS
jgi:hypothetical protein